MKNFRTKLSGMQLQCRRFVDIAEEVFAQFGLRAVRHCPMIFEWPAETFSLLSSSKRKTKPNELRCCHF